MLRFLCVFLAIQVIRVTQSAYSIDQGDYTLECSHEPMELAIVMDSSSSIRPYPFKQGKDFLKDFLSQYEIGPSAVHVALITFGRGIYPEQSFNLTDHTSMDDVSNAIHYLRYMQEPYTATGEGIKYMRTVQMSDQVTRPGVDKVAIVLTDGNSQETTKTSTEAAAARDDGITMIAIGVGEGIDESELINIAGDDSRVFRVDNYDQLKGIKEALGKTTCIKMKKPTPPATTCGEANPADVYFIFSPYELGSQATMWTKSAIANFIKNEDIQTGFRIGLATGDCPEDSGFDLDDYLLPESSRSLKNHLNILDHKRVPKLVERVMATGYDAEHGGRPTARDVAILVAPGGRRNRFLRSTLLDQAALLTNSGVTVFILDPYNSGVSSEGAMTISSRNPMEAAARLVSALCL